MSPRTAELERLTAAMRRHGLDFVILSTPPNVTYAAGIPAPLPAGFVADITGWLPALAVVSCAGDGILIVPDADASVAAGSPFDVITFETLGHELPADPPGTFAAALAEALRRAGLASTAAAIGAEPTLPRIAAKVVAAVCPQTDPRSADAALAEARSIKTPREVELLRVAVATADAGQQRLTELSRETTGALEDTMVWAECAAACERAAGRLLPFSGALVTGHSTAVWTAGGPVGRLIEPGEPALLDIGPRVSGYWADCANTVVLGGEANLEQQRFLTAAREACLAGIEALRPGRRCAEAWHAVHDALEAHGIAISHYAGHQVGTAVNEGPRLVPYDRTPIEPGMVFALEAGAYEGAPGSMGARCEKVALVTATGPEILSAFGWE